MEEEKIAYKFPMTPPEIRELKEMLKKRKKKYDPKSQH
jgi:hypothetical protein